MVAGSDVTARPALRAPPVRHRIAQNWPAAQRACHCQTVFRADLRGNNNTTVYSSGHHPCAVRAKMSATLPAPPCRKHRAGLFLCLGLHRRYACKALSTQVLHAPPFLPRCPTPVAILATKGNIRSVPYAARALTRRDQRDYRMLTEGPDRRASSLRSNVERSSLDAVPTKSQGGPRPDADRLHDPSTDQPPNAPSVAHRSAPTPIGQGRCAATW